MLASGCAHPRPIALPSPSSHIEVVTVYTLAGARLATAQGAIRFDLGDLYADVYGYADAVGRMAFEIFNGWAGKVGLLVVWAEGYQPLAPTEITACAAACDQTSVLLAKPKTYLAEVP